MTTLSISQIIQRGMLRKLEYINWEERGKNWSFLVTILSRNYLEGLMIWTNIISLNILTLGLDVKLAIFE